MRGAGGLEDRMEEAVGREANTQAEADSKMGLCKLVVGQERLYPRERGAIRPSARSGGRYGVVGGCDEKR